MEEALRNPQRGAVPMHRLIAGLALAPLVLPIPSTTIAYLFPKLVQPDGSISSGQMLTYVLSLLLIGLPMAYFAAFSLALPVLHILTRGGGRPSFFQTLLLGVFCGFIPPLLVTSAVAAFSPRRGFELGSLLRVSAFTVPCGLCIAAVFFLGVLWTRRSAAT